MSDLNLCVMTGRLGQDIELKYTKSGTPVCSPSLAIGGRKKEGDQWVDSVEWVPLVMWQRTAEVAAEYLRKGSHIRITGRFQTRNWEQDGVTRYRSEVIVSEMQMLGSKGDGQPSQGPQQGGSSSQQAPTQSRNPSAQRPEEPPPYDDDIHF